MPKLICVTDCFLHDERSVTCTTPDGNEYTYTTLPRFAVQILFILTQPEAQLLENVDDESVGRLFGDTIWSYQPATTTPYPVGPALLCGMVTPNNQFGTYDPHELAVRALRHVTDVFARLAQG